MAWVKRRAETNSSGRSLPVLKLVSGASNMERGSGDSRSKTAIFCSKPSSLILKLALSRPPIGARCSSLTVTKTLTSLTSTLMVVSGSGGASLDFLLSVLDGVLEAPGCPEAHGGLGTWAREIAWQRAKNTIQSEKEK